MPVLSRPQHVDNSNLFQYIYALLKEPDTVQHIGDVPNAQHNAQTVAAEVISKVATQITLSKRSTTVEAGGPDTKGLKYVIAAVVVPIGLVILTIVICMLRCRSKGKKAKIAIDTEKPKKDDFVSGVKISHTFKKTKTGESNIEIKVVPQDPEIFAKRKNIILQDIEKNGNLAEELRNNNYFNNYIDITQRHGSRMSTTNEIKDMKLIQPGNSIKKRMSHEMVIINDDDDMEEVDISDSAAAKQAKEVEDRNKSFAQNQAQKRKIPLYSVAGSKIEEEKTSEKISRESINSEGSQAINEEFYTPEDGSPEFSEKAQDVQSNNELQYVSQNVTDLQSKNTKLHRTLIDNQRRFIHDFDAEDGDEVKEIPYIPKAKNPIVAAADSIRSTGSTVTTSDSIASPNPLKHTMTKHSLLSNATSSHAQSIMTKSTAATSVSMASGKNGAQVIGEEPLPSPIEALTYQDTLKRKSDIQRVPTAAAIEIGTSGDYEVDSAVTSGNISIKPATGDLHFNPPAKVIESSPGKAVANANISRPDGEELGHHRSNSMVKLQNELMQNRKTTAMDSKQFSRDSFLDRNNSGEFEKNNAIYSTGDEDFDYESKRNELVRLSINLDTEHYTSSDSATSTKRSQLEDLPEIEEPISPRPKGSAVASPKEKPQRNFFENKRDSTVTEKSTKEDLAAKQIIDSQLTNTINDINRFLKENGVYTSPVIIDTGNVVLGGLVINNLSSETINKHLSKDSINILMNSKDCSPVIYNASMISPKSKVVSPAANNPAADPAAGPIAVNPSASSSNYDLVKNSSKLSPLASFARSPRHITSPPTINGVLSEVDGYINEPSHTKPYPNKYFNSPPMSSLPITQDTTQFQVINSPTIPKRSSKRSHNNLYQLQLQHQQDPLQTIGISGINAPVLSAKSSNVTMKSQNSKASRQSSNIRSSRALGINLKPQLSLGEEARLTNKTPDQIVRDKFYDSEESYNHTFDDDEEHQKQYVKMKSPSFVSPYANIV